MSLPSLINPLGSVSEMSYVQSGLMADYSFKLADETTIFDRTGNGYDLLIENRSANDGFGIKDIKAKSIKAMDWLTNNVTVEILACRIEDYSYNIGAGNIGGLGGFTSHPVNTNMTGACISGGNFNEPNAFRSPTLFGDFVMVAPFTLLEKVNLTPEKIINLAFTIKPNESIAYLNGNKMAYINKSPFFSGDKLFKLGVNIVANSSSQWGENNRFPYTFLAARVYNRALTREELRVNAAADAGNYNMGRIDTFIEPYNWTNNIYTISSTSFNSTYPAWKLMDYKPIKYTQSGGIIDSWVSGNTPTFPIKIRVTDLPSNLSIRYIKVYQLANGDGGTRDIQVFRDYNLTQPLSQKYTMQNNITNPSALAPGDELGSEMAYGSETNIYINQWQVNEFTIAITSKWGIYYAGLQEIEIEGYYL